MTKFRLRVTARGQFVAYGFATIAVALFSVYGALTAAAHVARLYPTPETAGASTS
jgi:hypothetical protein